MAMTYAATAIPDPVVPRASAPLLQHLLDIYAGEISKVDTVWACFTDDDLPWRIHPKSSTVQEVMKHQLLSERRFFGEFLDSPEPAAGDVVPAEAAVAAYRRRLVALAVPRLSYLAPHGEAWWTRPTRPAAL